jgi:hypothetical protein
MDEAAPIPRRDAWYAQLSEEERWAVYERALHLPYPAVAEYVKKTYDVTVSRSAYYRFQDWMRPQQSARRLEQAVLARREAKALADRAGAKKELSDAFMAMGAEIALRTGDAAQAQDWIKMAASLVAAAQKDREIELRAQAQKLDREKFEAAERRLAQMAELSDAARGGKVDPATVADEIDRILGRRK